MTNVYNMDHYSREKILEELNNHYIKLGVPTPYDFSKWSIGALHQFQQNLEEEKIKNK